MSQYEVKVKYTKELPNATLKRVSENYLLAKGESFTDAEAITTGAILGEIRGESSIEAIKKVAYQEIMYAPNGEGDWYKCSTTYTFDNPDSGKESKIKNTYLVQAINIDQASDIMKEYMGGQYDSFEIPSIVKTTIMDVIEDRVLSPTAKLKKGLEELKKMGAEISVSTGDETEEE